MADNTANKEEQEKLGGELFHVGNYLGLRQEIDPGFTVTKLIRNNLSVVDLIPVDFSINWQKIVDPKQFAMTYDFDQSTKNYRERCEKYKLKPYDGLRLWLTDDTQAYEEVTNNFENNIIESKMNSLSEWGQKISGALKAFNIDQKMGGEFVSDKVIEPIGGMIKGALGTSEDSDGAKIIDGVVGAASTVTGMLLQGKQVSLPKIWRQSDYNPSLTFNVKLVSPYGTPDAIKNFIIRPLIHILLMSSPESTDGLTYGLYQPVKIKAYGMSNINLGAITSISLRRGGRETAYNIYRQPLQIDVGINCIPLSPGFAHMTELPDVATLDDASKPYEENAKGSPAFTTVGNIIQSLRPIPDEIISKTVGTTSSNYSIQSSKQEEVKADSTPPAPQIPDPVKSIPDYKIPNPWECGFGPTGMGGVSA